MTKFASAPPSDRSNKPSPQDSIILIGNAWLHSSQAERERVTAVGLATMGMPAEIEWANLYARDPEAGKIPGQKMADFMRCRRGKSGSDRGQQRGPINQATRFG